MNNATTNTARWETSSARCCSEQDRFGRRDLCGRLHRAGCLFHVQRPALSRRGMHGVPGSIFLPDGERKKQTGRGAGGHRERLRRYRVRSHGYDALCRSRTEKREVAEVSDQLSALSRQHRKCSTRRAAAPASPPAGDCAGENVRLTTTPSLCRCALRARCVLAFGVHGQA